MGEGTGVGWLVIAVANLTFPFKKCFILMFRFKPRILSSQENHTPPFHHELHPIWNMVLKSHPSGKDIFYLHVVIYQKVLLTSWYGRYSASCSIALGRCCPSTVSHVSLKSLAAGNVMPSWWFIGVILVWNSVQRTGERMLHPGRLTWNL